MNKFLGKLGHFSWSFHNFIAHPVMEILHLIGLQRASNWVHDKTVPEQR